jgi:transposase
MDEPACPGCRELRDRVAELEAQVARLTGVLDEARRAGKRQAAPFRKGPPKPDPKTPGRKAGEQHGTHGHRPPPAEPITECHEAPLPDTCPYCRGRLVETDVAEQFQTEIPRQPLIRKFRVHIGHCQDCGKRTQGRHELQTSDALGAAASQIGPDAQAAATILHTRHGLSHGKVQSVFDALFGIKLTRGASAQINVRTADRLEPDYQLILDDLKNSERIVPDETGWRIGGHPAWLHVGVGDRATAYVIDSQRSAEVLQRVIGEGYSGILTHDGYSSYGTRFPAATHQQCVGHVLRRARDLLATAVRGAVHFPQRVIALFTEAIHLRNEHRRDPRAVPRNHLREQRDAFELRLLKLVSPPRVVPAYARFADHLWNHFSDWFRFLYDPKIEPTNWQAEQAIRPAVVNRKVWGGNRTPDGAKAQSILMSVLETCQRQAQSLVDYVSQTLRSFKSRTVQRTTLLLGR